MAKIKFFKNKNKESKENKENFIEIVENATISRKRDDMCHQYLLENDPYYMLEK